MLICIVCREACMNNKVLRWYKKKKIEDARERKKEGKKERRRMEDADPGEYIIKRCLELSNEWPGEGGKRDRVEEEEEEEEEEDK